jgi:hypothetical protein
MAAKPPDAFLSYTRFDDHNDGGAISEFCRRLANAVRAVTGVPFEIFQDVEGIGVGEHWPGKLDRMLDEARFIKSGSTTLSSDVPAQRNSPSHQWSVGACASPEINAPLQDDHAPHICHPCATCDASVPELQ